MLLVKCLLWKKAHVVSEVMSLLRVGSEQAFSTARELMGFCAGPIDGTEGMNRLGAKLSDKEKKALGIPTASDIPLQRAGDIGDVANATIFLFSDAASYVTGQVLVSSTFSRVVRFSSNFQAVDGGAVHTQSAYLPYPSGILDPSSVHRMIKPRL